jgi:hypothetical protein
MKIAIKNAIDVVVPKTEYTNMYGYNPYTKQYSIPTLDGYEFESAMLDTDLYDELCCYLRINNLSKNVMSDALYLNYEIQQGYDYYKDNGGWIVLSTNITLRLNNFNAGIKNTINAVLHGPYGQNTDYVPSDDEMDKHEACTDKWAHATSLLYDNIFNTFKNKKGKVKYYK